MCSHLFQKPLSVSINDVGRTTIPDIIGSIYIIPRLELADGIFQTHCPLNHNVSLRILVDIHIRQIDDCFRWHERSVTFMRTLYLRCSTRQINISSRKTADIPYEDPPNSHHRDSSTNELSAHIVSLFSLLKLG